MDGGHHSARVGKVDEVAVAAAVVADVHAHAPLGLQACPVGADVDDRRLSKDVQLWHALGQGA